VIHRTLADLVVGLHFLFVVFVVVGGLLLVRWPALVWVHLPAAVWGALIEFRGWICPLTPLEKSLRARAGEAGYQGGFIEHYLLPVLYPSGLTQGVQLALGSLVIGVNVVIYWWVFLGGIRARRPARRPRQTR
jgi:Protein of Unknown function (DUF2784)